MHDAVVECSCPSTAAEVLELLVRIRCIDDDERRLGEVRQWFLRCVVNLDELPVDDDGVIDWPVTEDEDIETFAWVWSACLLLIDGAALDADVVRDITRLEDRKNGVPNDWEPASKCDCVQCRWKPEYGPMPELPDEHECIYQDLDPRAAHVIAQLAGVEDLHQPWWAVQAQTAMQRAQWRRYRYERYQREIEGPEYESAAAELGDLLRGHRG